MLAFSSAAFSFYFFSRCFSGFFLAWHTSLLTSAVVMPYCRATSYWDWCSTK